MDMIRLLRANEIECRVSTISEKGLSLLLYKDARVDQKILDETFSPLGWKRTHQSIDGNLYCTVEIWDDEKKQWIAKQDVGTQSYTEKEKGQASDSFKRACFNIGIGRELYTAPDFIWIPADKVRIERKGNKLVTYERFHVKAIDYNKLREITMLEIGNAQGKTIYRWGVAPAKEPAQSNDRPAEVQDKPIPKSNQKAKVSGLSNAQKKGLQQELQRTGIALEAVLSRYQLSSPDEMGMDVYNHAMGSLRKTRTKDHSVA